MLENLKMLIIDEADTLFKSGFEDEINKIIKLLPKSTRVTAIFSTSISKNVEDLACLSLKNPVRLEVSKNSITNAGSEQGYCVVDPARKFQLLFTFLRRNLKKKVMVFMSHSNAVKFYSDLLNHIDLPVLNIHSKQTQQKRASTYLEFT